MAYKFIEPKYVMQFNMNSRPPIPTTMTRNVIWPDISRLQADLRKTCIWKVSTIVLHLSIQYVSNIGMVVSRAGWYGLRY